MGPFIAIIASGLTFMAFWVQYEANERQRHDIALERFENTLFQLMHVQENITNNLYYSPQDAGDPLFEKKLWEDMFSIFYIVLKPIFTI